LLFGARLYERSVLTDLSHATRFIHTVAATLHLRCNNRRWTLGSDKARRFQAFLNTNFALLPAVKDGWQITPIALRFIGGLLILYGCMFASGYAAQLMAIEAT